MVYNNGARVNTSFITNMEPSDIRIKTAPELLHKIRNIYKFRTRKERVYPYNFVNTTILERYVKQNISLSISDSECDFIRGIYENGKVKPVFGGGFIVTLSVARQRCSVCSVST